MENDDKLKLCDEARLIIRNAADKYAEEKKVAEISELSRLLEIAIKLTGVDTVKNDRSLMLCMEVLRKISAVRKLSGGELHGQQGKVYASNFLFFMYLYTQWLIEFGNKRARESIANISKETADIFDKKIEEMMNINDGK